MLLLEKLTLPRLVRYVLPTLPVAGGWRWIDATPLSAVLGRVLGGRALAFRMLDVRDEDGLLLRLRIAHRDLAELQADVVAERAFQERLARPDVSGRLPSFLAKSAAAVVAADRTTLSRALYVIQVCAWEARRTEGRAELLLESRPWFAALARYAARHGVALRPVPPSSSWKERVRRMLGPVVVDALKRLKAGRIGKSASVSGAPRALATECYTHLNLDRPEHRTDLFFWKPSRLKADDILVLFGVPRYPLDGERLAEVRRHGLDALATVPAAAASGVPLYSAGLSWSSVASRLMAGAEQRWLDERVADYRREKAFWRGLFAQRGVKAHVTWYKNDGTHCAVADALAELGGVATVYQRSFESLPAPELAADTDIHFGFSRQGADLLRRDGSRVRYNVTTGFLSDHMNAFLRPRAMALRAELEKAGARRVVALFDENSLDDERWHTGHGLQRDNYEFLLGKVLSEPWFGLVCKPKVPDTLRARLGPIAEMLERAIATGRCKIYEHGPVFGSHVPAEAAMAADLAVHGHLCAGTAAIEAVLAGTPTLLLDREGWTCSPLYRLGVGKVVFKDWSSLWDAAKARFAGDASIGDWSSMLDEFDQFRDGRAAQRMGDFLADLLDALKDGLGREAAMDRAAERYAALWGSDKITEIKGRSWLAAPLAGAAR
jgi:hypothetical protein